MALVFKTPEDSADRVEINGVGVAPAFGVGGIALSHASERMHELQDGDGKPLKGNALKAAAERWGEPRGLIVVNLKDSEIAGLKYEAGEAPDRPPAEQVAVDEYNAMFGEPEDPTDHGALPAGQAAEKE